MIEIDHCKIIYDEDVILQECSFDIEPQSIVVIKGESGSGKTSLLYRLGLISEDCEYSFKYNQMKVNIRNEHVKTVFRRRHISYVFQDNSLFDQYDVLDNLKLYASFNGKEYTDTEYEEMLRAVNLHISLHQSIDTLSGGEKQRLAIACALCKGGDLLLLDEPTSFLDQTNSRLIFSVIRNIRDRYHKTIIITSHDPLSEIIADRILEIRNRILYCRKINHITPAETSSDHTDHKMSYGSYIRYFLKKYRSYEVKMAMIMLGLLTTMFAILICSDYFLNGSLEAYLTLSENQFFITADETNVTVNRDLKPFVLDADTSDIDVYPYMTTIAMINQKPVTVVPLFEENDLNDMLLKEYRSDRVAYVGYHLYLNLIGEKADPKDSTLTLIVMTPDGKVIRSDTEYSFSGVLKPAYQCSYVKDNEDYIYISYEVLKEIYSSYSGKDYPGYTVFAHSFDDYVKKSKEFKNHGVNMFFKNIDEMNQLKMINTVIRYSVTLFGVILSVVILLLLLRQSMHRRDKELVMLKLNGTDNYKIVDILMIETLFQMMIALFGSVCILLLILRFYPQSFLFLTYITYVFFTSVAICTYILEQKTVKDLYVENVLRT